MRLFFFSTLYTFGLGCNIGADRISRYFKQLRIDTHIGVSPDSLRKRLREMETVLAEYLALFEARAVHKKKPIHITAAADETFFGDILMLVMMDRRNTHIEIITLQEQYLRQFFHMKISTELYSIRG